MRNHVADEMTMPPREITLADSLSPLLTSMKLFGLHFRCRTNMGDRSTIEKSRVQWNVYLIYATVMVILIWFNAVRMFSVFTNIHFTDLDLCFCVSLK